MAEQDSEDDREHMNGGTVLPALPPLRPRVQEPGRLGPRAGFPELSAAYATHSASAHQHFPAIYGELDEMRGAINLVGRRQHAQNEKLDRHGVTLDAIHTLLSGGVTASPSSPIPPMRDRSASNLEIVEHLIPKVERELSKRASETPGPGVGDSPVEVATLLKGMLESELSARAERERVKADAAELAQRRADEAEAIAENGRRDKAKRDEAIEDARTRRKERRTLVLQVAGALITAFVLWLCAGAYARAERAAGVAEGKTQAAPLLVPMPPETVSAVATATMTPATGATTAPSASSSRRPAR